MAEALLYVGTNTRTADSRGIYRLFLDRKTGALREAGEATPGHSPSFLAIDPQKRFLFAVSGAKTDGTSSVISFKITGPDGGLEPINQTSCGGDGPCHLVVHPTGKHVLVANYTSGGAAMIPFSATGRLGSPTPVQHEGSSVNPDRQRGPHAHSIWVDPSEQYALVPDLGLDKVMIYRLNLAKGRLESGVPAWARLAPGSGPRHFAFHPNGRWGYCINEMGNTVTTFHFDPATGGLHEVASAPTLPPGFKKSSTTADVHVHPNGKFVYGSNRGHDSIAMFAVNKKDGTLTATGHTRTKGKTPRNFGLDPSGSWLLALNQDSGTIFTFAIDKKTGALTASGHSAKVTNPCCVKFL